MSVENTSNLPSGNVGTGSSGSGGAGNSSKTDLSALSAAFANAFRTSLAGTSKGAPADKTLSEATGADPTADSQRRTELNREATDRHEFSRDFSREDRKSSDHSELRHDELQNEYHVDRERRDNLQAEYDRRFRRQEPAVSTSATNDPEPVDLPKNHAPQTPLATPVFDPNPILPNGPVAPIVPTGTVSAAASELAGSIQNVSPSIVFVPPVTAQMLPVHVGAVSGQGSAAPSGGIPANLQATVSVFTIFTASGRLGDEKDEEERRSGEIAGKKSKRKQGTAFFGEAVVRALNGTEFHSGQGDVEKRSGEADRVDFRFTPVSRREENETDPTAEHRTDDETPPESDASEERTPTELAELLRQMQAVKEPETVSTPSEAESSAAELAERVRLLQRVTAASLSAANQNGTVRFKLNLDGHGSLTLRIASRKSSRGERELAVRFETETETVARLLRDNLDELRAALAERDVVLREVEIKVQILRGEE